MAWSGPELTWADCVAEALQNNAELAAARAEVERADAEWRRVRSLGRPRIDAVLGVHPSASAEYFDEGAEAAAEGNYFAMVKARQLLWDAGAHANRVSTAAESLAVARHMYWVASATTRRRLRQTCIESWHCSATIRIAEQTCERRGQLAQRVCLRYESGQEHRGAVLAAEAREAAAAYERRRAQRAMVLAGRRLARIIGRDVAGDALDADAVPCVAGALGPAVVPEQEPDYAAIAAQHPRVKADAAAAEAAQAELNAARAERLPRITAQGGVALRDREDGRDGEWFAGAVLNVPLFEGGGSVARVAKSEAELRAARRSAESRMQGVIDELVARYAAWQEAGELLELRGRELTATETRARIAVAQYEAGHLSFDLWVLIEDQLGQAQRGLLEAQANSLVAEARWIEATGGTLEDVVEP